MLVPIPQPMSCGVCFLHLGNWLCISQLPVYLCIIPRRASSWHKSLSIFSNVREQERASEIHNWERIPPRNVPRCLQGYGFNGKSVKDTLFRASWMQAWSSMPHTCYKGDAMLSSQMIKMLLLSPLYSLEHRPEEIKQLAQSNICPGDLAPWCHDTSLKQPPLMDLRWYFRKLELADPILSENSEHRTIEQHAQGHTDEVIQTVYWTSS